MIKQGEVAFIKTTGESVFVLDSKYNVEVVEQDGTKVLSVMVKVRRPVAGTDGIRHQIDFFFEAELESLDEQKARFFAEREEVFNKYGKTTPDPRTPDSNPGQSIH